MKLLFKKHYQTSVNNELRESIEKAKRNLSIELSADTLQLEIPYKYMEEETVKLLKDTYEHILNQFLLMGQTHYYSWEMDHDQIIHFFKSIWWCSKTAGYQLSEACTELVSLLTTQLDTIGLFEASKQFQQLISNSLKAKDKSIIGAEAYFQFYLTIANSIEPLENKIWWYERACLAGSLEAGHWLINYYHDTNPTVSQKWSKLINSNFYDIEDSVINNQLRPNL